jgi:hypothetical protein
MEKSTSAERGKLFEAVERKKWHVYCAKFSAISELVSGMKDPKEILEFYYHFYSTASKSLHPAPYKQQVHL